MASATKPANVNELPDGALELAARLFDCARNNDAETLEAALSAGLPPNLRDAKGNSFLMLAAYHGHADLVRKLMERGADPNLLNDREQSPLAGAIFKHEMDVVKALVEGKADPDAGTPSSRQAAELFKNNEALQLINELSFSTSSSTTNDNKNPPPNETTSS